MRLDTDASRGRAGRRILSRRFHSARLPSAGGHGHGVANHVGNKVGRTQNWAFSREAGHRTEFRRGVCRMTHPRKEIPPRPTHQCWGSWAWACTSRKVLDAGTRTLRAVALRLLGLPLNPLRSAQLPVLHNKLIELPLEKSVS